MTTQAMIRKSILQSIGDLLPKTEFDEAPTPKKNPIKLALILSGSLAAAIAVSVAVPVSLSYQANKSNLVTVIPDKTGGLTLRPEDADWETQIRAEQGPYEEQKVQVTFGHGDTSAFQDFISHGTLTSFERDQPTVLSLIRVINYWETPGKFAQAKTTIYQHEGTFYDHVCGEGFAIGKAFTVTDTLTKTDFPAAAQGGNWCNYEVEIQGKGGVALSYTVSFDQSLEKIVSWFNASIDYELKDDGVYLYKNKGNN